MKLRCTVFGIFFLFLTNLHSQHPEGMVGGTYNFTSFTAYKQVIDDEVLEFNQGFEKHPELGKLYEHAPCVDCFEIIEKRTETSKYFVEKGSNGKVIFQQSSNESMHVRDAFGNYRTASSHLQPHPSMPGLYTAFQQPIPIGINTVEKNSFIGKEGKRVYFNRNLTLVFVPDGGEEQIVGPANWANYTAGDDGIYVTNAWDGIDIEMYTARGQVKTNFVIKNQLPQFQNGKLIIRDNLLLDNGLFIHKEKQKEFAGEIEIVDGENNLMFLMGEAIVFDQLSETKTSLNYKLVNDGLDIIIPNEWINRDPSVYPIIIDPLLSGSNNMAIAGSGYNIACFTGGCSYNLAMPVPAAITVTDIILTSFSYTASLPCLRSQGAMDFNIGACRSPATAGFYWFCNLATPGLCNGANISLMTDLTGCVPAPSCAPYNLNITMRFYRCNGAGAGCSNTCIGAATPWIMTVQGRTVEPINNITVLPAVNICEGSSTTLSETGQYGVPGYTYTWNPGGLSGSPSVSPTTSTNYTVTITDACGNTASATKQVNVILNNNPGFTINPNPACVGQNIAISGSGAGPATSYDWLIPSSSTPTVNNTQNVNVTYAAAGTYNITLNYASGACIFPSTQSITINSLSAPTANIVAVPSGPICAGTNVTFTANITNGGTTPTYQWQVNGTNVGTNSNTYSSSTLANGDVVTVILTSSSPCASPASVTSNSIVITVSPPVLPTINIVAAPAGSICTGTNVTFTANITNGGTTPAYQWQINGTNVGTNSNTFSSTTLNNGDVVTCILTSNDPCASPASVTSNNIVMTVNPILLPTINIVAAPSGPICSGTNVTFTANITNGGSAPNYQWQINGTNVGTNSNTFSSTTLNNGDAVTCTLTSNATCASPTVVVSNSIVMSVTPTVIPTINIVAVPSGPICAGTNVTFTANITNGGAVPIYQWQVNGVNVGTNSNTYAYSAFNNADVVTCILTSNAPCASPASVTSNSIIMTVNPLLTPTINIVSSSLPACSGSNITFTANITNGGAAPVYQWQVNGSNVGTNSNTYTSSTLSAGDVVTCALTSNAICLTTSNASSNNIVVSYFPPPTITANPDFTICEQEIVTFTATPADGNPSVYNVVWQPVNLGGNSITLSPDLTTTYTVTVTDGCGATASATTTVTVNQRPIAAFTFAPNPPDLSVQPTVFTDASTNASEWLWNFGNGNTSNLQNPTYEYTAGGTFPVILTVTSPQGCTDTTIAQLIIEEIYSLFIPSAFTPNGDEINPIFFAYGNGISSYKMEIFNRWGVTVFSSEDIMKGWNGELPNGTQAEQGVYTYRVDVVFSNKKNQAIMGKVTLIR